MAEPFDVFLSHNSKDKALVRRIAKRLAAYGLSPWLDEDRLQPGVPFQDGLKEAMRTTRAAAVFVGAHGTGSWQQVEIRAFLNQMVRRRLPVIPVFLPGAPDQPEIDLVLEDNTRVDLREGISTEGIKRLVWGITGEKPQRRKRTKPTPASGPSYAATVEGAPDLTPHFRGRQAEVASCLAALRSSRLVTIVGLPGTGKTELSLATAREALADPALRPQRALWLSLAGVRSVDEIAGRLALAFQVSRFEKIEDVAAAIGQQRVLLLLDNAEDLIVPDRLAFQELCGTLLRLCPGLRLLLSSRRGLGDVIGFAEVEIPVGRLRPPFDLEVFRSAAAARLSPEELGSSDLNALVAALDGHPLSLMLMAGRAGRGMSLSELRRQLERDGDATVMARELLAETKTGSTADERLRTKRLISSLNLSYDPLAKLHPAAAEVFLWLGLFPAGLLSDLVPAIFGEQGEEHRALLLDYNLAEMVQGRDTRLVLPAPVRWYAKRRLAEIPAERQRELLITTSRSLGRIFGNAYNKAGSEQARTSFDLAVREEPNLANLLPTASEFQGAGAIADALARWIRLMVLAGQSSGAIRLEHAAKAISATAPGTYAEAQILAALGDLYVRTDRLREAEDAYQSALPIFQQIEDRFGEANTRQALGDLYVRTGRLREAEDAYQSALPIFQQIEARLGEANTLQGLGDLAKAHGDLVTAFGLFLQALAIQRSISDLLGEGGSYIYLARTARAATHLEKAVALGRQAWRIYRRIEDRFGQLLALDDLAACFAYLEDEEAYASSMILAWHLARTMEEPSAGQRRDLLRQIAPEFDSEAEPSEIWLPAVEETLSKALERYEQAFADRGEDPLAPLPANPLDPGPDSTV